LILPEFGAVFSYRDGFCNVSSKTLEISSHSVFFEFLVLFSVELIGF